MEKTDDYPSAEQVREKLKLCHTNRMYDVRRRIEYEEIKCILLARKKYEN